MCRVLQRKKANRNRSQLIVCLEDNRRVEGLLDTGAVDLAAAVVVGVAGGRGREKKVDVLGAGCGGCRSVGRVGGSEAGGEAGEGGCCQLAVVLLMETLNAQEEVRWQVVQWAQRRRTGQATWVCRRTSRLPTWCGGG